MTWLNWLWGTYFDAHGFWRSSSALSNGRLITTRLPGEW